jgi:hypothetical protein
MIFRRIKFWYYSFLTVPFVLGGVVIVISVINKKFYGILFTLSVAIPFGILFIILNSKTKKVVKELFDISSSEFMWNSYNVLNKIRKDKKQKMLDYLKRQGEELESIDIQELSESAAVKAEKSKVKFPLIPSIFGALFVSLWNNFFSWAYKSENVKNLEEAFKILTSSSLILFMIILLFIAIKSMLLTIMDDIINRDCKSMEGLSQLLHDIVRDLEKEERRKIK